MDEFRVNDRVKILKRHCNGTIAFIGKTRFKFGIWYGIVLDEPKGLNNGSVNGTFYFYSKKRHGLFVRGYQLKKQKTPAIGTRQRQLGDTHEMPSISESSLLGHDNDYVDRQSIQSCPVMCRSITPTAIFPSDRNPNRTYELQQENKALNAKLLDKDMKLQACMAERTKAKQDAESLRDQLITQRAQINKLRKNQIERKNKDVSLIDKCERFEHMSKSLLDEKERFDKIVKKYREKLSLAKQRCRFLGHELEKVKLRKSVFSDANVEQYVVDIEKQNTRMKEGLLQLIAFAQNHEANKTGDDTKQSNLMKVTRKHIMNLIPNYANENTKEACIPTDQDALNFEGAKQLMKINEDIQRFRKLATFGHKSCKELCYLNLEKVQKLLNRSLKVFLDFNTSIQYHRKLTIEIQYANRLLQNEKALLQKKLASNREQFDSNQDQDISVGSRIQVLEHNKRKANLLEGQQIANLKQLDSAFSISYKKGDSTVVCAPLFNPNDGTVPEFRLGNLKCKCFNCKSVVPDLLIRDPDGNSSNILLPECHDEPEKNNNEIINKN